MHDKNWRKGNEAEGSTSAQHVLFRSEMSRLVQGPMKRPIPCVSKRWLSASLWHSSKADAGSRLIFPDIAIREFWIVSEVVYRKMTKASEILWVNSGILDPGSTHKEVQLWIGLKPCSFQTHLPAALAFIPLVPIQEVRIETCWSGRKCYKAI